MKEMDDPTHEMIRRLLVVVAFMVRIPGWDDPYWYDEVFSRWVSRLPLERALAAIAGDVHPPLFYLLLMPLPDGLLRLVPLACSIVGLLAVIELARALGLDDRAALCVGALYALSPFQAFYGIELRMYALLQLEAMIYLIALWRGRVWVATIAAALMLATHHIGGVYWLVWGIVPFVRGDRRRQWAALALPALVPLATGLIGQAAELAGGHWLWRPSLADAVLLPMEFVVSAPEGSSGLSVLALIAGVLLLALAGWGARRNPWPLALMALPVVAAFAISWLWRPVFMARPLIAAAPLFYVAVVIGIVHLPSVRARLAVAALAAPVAVLAMVLPNTRASYLSRVQVEPVAAAIGDLPPSATIYHSSLYSRVEFEQIYGSDRQIIYPPPPALLDGYTLATRQALGIIEAAPDDLARDPDVVVIYHGLVYNQEAESAVRRMVADQAYKLVYVGHGREDFYYIEVFKNAKTIADQTDR